MAKISTYVINTVPTVNDMVIGTDVNSADETKNFQYKFKRKINRVWTL